MPWQVFLKRFCQMDSLLVFHVTASVIAAAYILDFFFGDPEKLPHPIIAMGRAISFFEPKFRALPFPLFWSGCFFALFLIAATWLVSSIIIAASIRVHPLLAWAVQAVLLFYCFSSTTLEKEAMGVFKAIKKGGLQAGRDQVARIVGRNTQKLDEEGIVRACIETVAENFVDGFLAPLFFALIGGVPAALAYKMINTLDSMVGYKNDRYLMFGRASARIDDIANFIPSKLSVMVISLAAILLSPARGESAFKTGILQGHRHSSPNAGYPEAAFSGALHMKLGGDNVYHGKVVHKPEIGTQYLRPGKEKIQPACDLMMISSLLATLIAVFIQLAR